MSLITVMTYNIQLGAGSDSMPRYIVDWLSVSLARPHSAKNIETIIENIKTISPDILAVTESEGVSARNQFMNYNELIQNGAFRGNNDFGRYASFQCHYHSTKSGVTKKNQYNAIFAKPEHEISAESSMDFTNSEQRRSIGRADIKIKTGDSYLPISAFVTHLSVAEKYHKKQVEEVLEFAEEGDGLKFITGDFNVKGDDSVLNPLREKYQEVGPYNTWPSWGTPKDPLDRMFVSKEFGILRSAVPIFKGSDHLPLVATLEY
ncbi:MAG: endonuclease/exonuclease/phosphatase family protein [Nanoarchaeota archaeon]|nr:endonuclease/exonuclease/phosphatase family protein [Nanoarchaeota archaeon]